MPELQGVRTEQGKLESSRSLPLPASGSERFRVTSKHGLMSYVPCKLRGHAAALKGSAGAPPLAQPRPTGAVAAGERHLSPSPELLR